MKSALALIILLLLGYGCTSQPAEKSESAVHLAVADSSADFLQMRQDHEGNLMAWWVQNDSTGAPIVCHSLSEDAGESFGEAQCIAESRDVNPANGEGLPELVVKNNGTYVLVFARRNPDALSQFASSVLYTRSFDRGDMWTDAAPVHSDTGHENSHAFPTAVLLPDGEVGAAWLDGRHGLDHSVIYFARTEGRDGFGEDFRIGGPACQCCKLYLEVGEDERVHLAYRHLTDDNIRDISHIVSKDNGNSFSSPAVVHRDNWQIMACPHNGPALTAGNGSATAIWYTGGEGDGLYFASRDSGGTFSGRTRLAGSASRPYIGSVGDHRIAVWDELFQGEDRLYRRVRMSRIDAEGTVSQTEYLSPAGIEASMPGVLEMEGGDLMVMWTQKGEEGNRLWYRRFGNYGEPSAPFSFNGQP